MGASRSHQVSLGPRGDAVLHELGDAQRRDLLDHLDTALPAERTTGVLTYAVRSLGGVDAPDAAAIRALTVGERDRIVLALRGALFGDALPCVAVCGCGTELEFPLSVGGLLDAAAGSVAEEAGGETAHGRRVRVRPVTGGDHEQAARLARDDPAQAAHWLTATCVLEPDVADESTLELAAELLSEIDPMAEIVAAGPCPECGDVVAATVDPVGYLWRELERADRELDWQVHALASRYGWPEAEIVAMPSARRSRYLALLDADGAFA